jgi:glucokinase
MPVVRERLLELAGDHTINAVGISIGGPLDHTAGIVLNFPHLPGWRSIPIVEIVREMFRAPAAMDNDANLGALAEHRFGVGQDTDPFVYLTLSTGIGGGVIIDGELIHGIASGAGEMGHITVDPRGPRCACGNRGCLERMASGTNIARRARELLQQKPESGALLRNLAGGSAERITAETVREAFEQGDPVANLVWMDAVRALAIGLGSIIHVLSPETIALGGGLSLSGESLFAPLRRQLENHVFYIPLDRIRIEPARLGHDSALTGAGFLATQMPTDYRSS